MKTFTTLLVVATFACLAGCKTASYFETPNAVKNIPGTVYLLNGDSINGKITVTTNYVTGGKLKVYTANNPDPVKIHLNEIKGYKSADDHYTLKEIRGGITRGTTFSFMKRVSTTSNNIGLYESTVKQMMVDKNKPSNTLTKKYYVKLPGERSNIVYAIKDIKRIDQLRSFSKSDNTQTVLKLGLTETLHLNICEKDLRILSPFLFP